MTRVLGFSVYKYSKQQIENLDSFDKFRLHLQEKYFNTKCYDSIEDFFKNLNNDNVDTKDFWWFMIEI